MRCSATFAAFALVCVASSAAAQTDSSDPPELTGVVSPVADGTAAAPVRTLKLPTESLKRNPRPRGLMPMYVAYAALQVADVVSTHRAVNAGFREANPLLGSGQGTAAVLTKLAGASFTFYLVEKYRQRHPRAAVVTMAFVNAGISAVVAHNLSIVRR